MQDAAIERLAKIISDKHPNGDRSRRRKPIFQIHIGLAEGWFTLFLLITVVYSTIWCVQAADWVDHLNILTLTTALGLIIGLIAAKQHRLPRLPTHLIAIGFGLLLAFWQTAGADYAGNTLTLARGIHEWFQIAFAGGTSNDDSIFLFLITALGFILAYSSAWLLYRTRSPWLLIVANAIVLLINLSNVEPGYIVYLVVFLFASLLLLLRFNLYESVQRWRQQGLRYGDDLGWDVMQAGILISIGVLLFSWLLPWGYVNDTASQLWNANANPYVQLENAWNRLVPVTGGFTPANHGNFADTLALGGNPNLNNDVVFIVQSADSTQYLASLSYDTYDPIRGWIDSPTNTISLNSNQVIGTESALWHPVQQQITVVNPPGEKYPYLFGASQIASVDQPAQVQTTTSNGSVIAWLSRNGDLAAGQRYTIISYVSAADVQTLRSVPLPVNSPTLPANFDGPVPSTYYEPAILNTYLQLPANLDPAIKQLARNVIARSHVTTMYDQAVALEAYLRTNYTYDVNIHRPPGSEGVSWFLFHSDHHGFCNYFASAMAIMARSLGMPARVVAGYTNGQFDVRHNQRIIRGIDAHAWTQIYFATYGWVNFEPSAGFSSFVRPLPGSANFTTPISAGGLGSNPGKNNPGHGRVPNSPEDVAGITTTPAVAQAQWRERISFTLWGLIFLVLLGLAIFSIWWRRLFRDRSISVQVYGRICLLANWAGITLRRSQTPYEYISTLAAVAPEQAPALERLGNIYVRDLWADPASNEHPRRTGETDELPGLWKRLQPALFLYVARHPYFLRWLPARLSGLLRTRLTRLSARQRSKPEVEVIIDSVGE
jgi:Transglutaminase-like superfamily